MPVPVLSGLSSLVSRHPFILCDIWGVVHDGACAFLPAVDALSRARRGGVSVALVSNSPRRAFQVREQLQALGVGEDAYDTVITSGELTRSHLERDFQGQKFYHLGPQEDRATVEQMDLFEVDHADEADVIVATGLVGRDVDAHMPLLAKAAQNRRPLLCANPDRVVRHEGKMFICAGAVADRYEAMGGPVVWLGKPAPPPYAASRHFFAEHAGREVSASEQLIIGDGLATDIAGAAREGIASILIEHGVHHADFLAQGIEPLMKQHRAVPAYRMEFLQW
ncbi:TIGR01459 family HAD-type hydrolase [Iodidimonas muriae]|uniref:TIGR01459 family HAD-type hydrolase n=1 Tax=Iodidimonas muriae TaxID=261467 RepID=UPI0012304DEB|nr:TIGR01459 family HAD-type hydrolase [Iodidimonas muriae]